MMFKNLCVEGCLCASVVGCGDLGDKDVSVVKGSVLRVGRISGLPGHCLGSMRSTSSSGSRSTELMTGGWPGLMPDSEPLTASLKSSLFAVFLVQPEVALTAPTRSTCSPSIAFKAIGGYQVMLHDNGYGQQLSNKIHHMSGYNCTIFRRICTWMHPSCIIRYSITHQDLRKSLMMILTWSRIV